jgi:hypothetical protein
MYLIIHPKIYLVAPKIQVKLCTLEGEYSFHVPSSSFRLHANAQA